MGGKDDRGSARGRLNSAWTFGRNPEHEAKLHPGLAGGQK